MLRKGRDPRKDQSYFLFSLRQEQLARALCPLGGMEKTEIRAIARRLGLKTADKVDSQEICFVPGNDYKAFLKSHLEADEFHPGGIYDKAGHRVGEHEGIEMFTIGQRKGLPGGSPSPRYVIDIDPATSRVIVGEAEDLVIEEFEMDHATWQEGVTEPFDATVKIRYAHPGAAATVYPGADGTARVRLDKAQRAVTPGQAAVCYRGDEVHRRRLDRPPATSDAGRLREQGMAEDALVVLSAFGSLEEARRVARLLVEEKLAACANILPAVESIYRWQEAVRQEPETMVVFKTNLDRYYQLEARLTALHSYEVPEVLALPVRAGALPYLRWVDDSCR